ASDEVFLRRAFLDLLGILPPEKERADFLANPNREKLIDDLLARDVDYAEHWLTFWNDLLRNDYVGTGFIDGGRKQITGWLHHALKQNVPYDQFVRQLIAPPTDDSQGFIAGIKWRGEVNASQRRELQFSQNISQVFLGINMKCASCHDSFIDRWKLEEAYHLAAIIAEQPLEIHRCDKPIGETAKAAWIFPELGEINPQAPKPARLQQLAGLMTHRENGRFTRTLVNRIWHRMMGRGIVHPVDAMHTEPWNGDLLDWLAEDFAENGYDIKKLLARIANSAAYQSETAPTPTEDELVDGFTYRGPVARRLTAEQFIDAVWTLTKTHPVTPTAKVTRYKVEPGKFLDVELTGKWVWSPTEWPPKAGEAISIRKIVTLDEAPKQARAVVTVDNSYELWVNGKKVGGDGDWMTIAAFDLKGFLRKGANQILIVARNGGNGPNAAAAYFEADIDGQRVATDGTWQWSKTLPDKRGKFAKKVEDWGKVKVIAGGWMAQVADGARAGLANVNAPPVRASLVKSDLLMRSLGRPNREQVVTVRPEQLSTLQAIDLANGKILTGLLQRGAANLEGEFSGQPAEKIIETLFVRAVSRKPSDSESAVLSEIFNAADGPRQGLEDVLWAVLMLPEFQLVR
ncbi:MAG: DUF1553 domain-containing protein, partial [Verrucomicrobiales bacterium]|nr:DUF1553 domain-containing protein [Verrucomicrobiales bacterium]